MAEQTARMRQLADTLNQASQAYYFGSEPIMSDMDWDKLYDELLELLARRMRASRDIGQYKKEHNMPILQAKRYEDLLARRAEQAVQLGMDREFMRSVLQAIHEESIRQQMEVLGR